MKCQPPVENYKAIKCLIICKIQKYNDKGITTNVYSHVGVITCSNELSHNENEMVNLSAKKIYKEVLDMGQAPKKWLG